MWGRWCSPTCQQHQHVVHKHVQVDEVLCRGLQDKRSKLIHVRAPSLLAGGNLAAVSVFIVLFKGRICACTTCSCHTCQVIHAPASPPTTHATEHLDAPTLALEYRWNSKSHKKPTCTRMSAAATRMLRPPAGSANTATSVTPRPRHAYPTDPSPAYSTPMTAVHTWISSSTWQYRVAHVGERAAATTNMKKCRVQGKLGSANCKRMQALTATTSDSRKGSTPYGHQGKAR